MTCGILAPRPGIELAPPALEGKVLTTGPPGKSLCLHFIWRRNQSLCELLLDLDPHPPPPLRLASLPPEHAGHVPTSGPVHPLCTSPGTCPQLPARLPPSAPVRTGLQFPPHPLLVLHHLLAHCVFTSVSSHQDGCPTWGGICVCFISRWVINT